MSVTSLWPEFKFDTKPRGIKRILEEAGGDLSRKTNKVLGFEVSTTQTVSGFAYRCFIVIRSNGFRVELCSVETGLTTFPASLFTPDGNQVTGIPDEAALLRHLENIFHSPRTQEIVLNLVANFG